VGDEKHEINESWPGSRITGISNGSTHKRANWWLRLTSYGTDFPQQTVTQREMARRSRLTSWIVLGLLVIEFVLLPAGISDPATITAIVIALLGTVIAAVLNRVGMVSLAGSVLVLLVIAALVGAVTNAPKGQLSMVYLPAYDLFAIAVVIGASILPRAAAFVIAVINIAIIAADFQLQPKAADVLGWIAFDHGSLPLIVRPIALQIIIATVAYLWVRGTDEAIRRADRAEEVATLEHTIAEQRRQLEIGVQQILETHVRIANGDFSARAPMNQDNLLWQISASLNNLLSRLQKSGQAEYQLRRTEEELRRLASAIDDAQSGKRPIWPAPTGTPADLILSRIAQRNRQPSSVAGVGMSPQRAAPAPLGSALDRLPPISGPNVHTDDWPPIEGIHPTTGSHTFDQDYPENPWFSPSEQG